MQESFLVTKRSDFLEKIHKFSMHLLGEDVFFALDVNSGAVHVLDKMTYDLLDFFKPEKTNEEIFHETNFSDKEEVFECLDELRDLVKQQELFAPDIEAPVALSQDGVVKSLCLMVAHDCNLRCRYCFADTGELGGKRQVMSYDVAKKAIDYLIEHCPRKHCEIDFFGGEPLMNMPVVRQITKYIREKEIETGKQFKLTLTTNGILLNEDNRKFLNENHISLVLSLDGRKEVHDKMRPDAGGHGTYDRALKNFLAVVKERHQDNYYLRGTYTKYNLDFTNDVISMADAGFDILSVEPVVAKDAPYAIEEEDLEKIFAEYDRLTETYLERRRDGKGFFFFHFNMDLSNGPCVQKRLAGCGAGHEYFAVAANGDLYPCHQFVGREKYKLGSVFTGIEKKDLPKQFRQAHVLNKPKCKECWAKFFCSGGCHANADLFHGNLLEPYEIGCALQKKRLECAIAVQALLALKNL